jgi:hypothetical protein
VLPAAVRGLRLGGHRRGVRLDAHGRRGDLAPGPLDVRPRRAAADAGRRARPRAVRRGRCAECAAVRVRSAHLRRGHRHLRPKGACVRIVTNGSKRMTIDDNQTTHILIYDVHARCQQDFSKMIVLSFSLVTCAAVMYTVHAYRAQKAACTSSTST